MILILILISSPGPKIMSKIMIRSRNKKPP